MFDGIIKTDENFINTYNKMLSGEYHFMSQLTETNDRLDLIDFSKPTNEEPTYFYTKDPNIKLLNGNKVLEIAYVEGAFYRNIIIDLGHIHTIKKLNVSVIFYNAPIDKDIKLVEKLGINIIKYKKIYLIK